MNGFKIKKEGDHVVLFNFDNKEEMEKVIDAEPWSFDKHLVVLYAMIEIQTLGIWSLIELVSGCKCTTFW